MSPSYRIYIRYADVSSLAERASQQCASYGFMGDMVSSFEFSHVGLARPKSSHIHTHTLGDVSRMTELSSYEYGGRDKQTDKQIEHLSWSRQRHTHIRNIHTLYQNVTFMHVSYNMYFTYIVIGYIVYYAYYYCCCRCCCCFILPRAKYRFTSQQPSRIGFT